MMHPNLLLLRRTAVAVLAGLIFSQTAAFTPNANKKPDAKKADPAAAKKAEEEKKTPTPPPVYKIKEAPFEMKIELDGMFEAKKATQIAIAPEAWADLMVVEAAAHGTMVKKGDVIARFDADKLKKAIEDLESGRPLAELTLATSVAELETLEKTTPIDLESGRRSKMEAEENLAYFEDVTLPMRKKDETEGLKRYEQSVAYAEEELNQLKKMYENDDMTEETEEIILQRAQNQVNSARWMLEQAKARTDRALNTTITRDHDARKRAMEKTQITWRAGEKTTRNALEQKRLEVAKAHRDHEKSGEKLAEMQGDLKLLTVTAPHDGIVYYGAASRGKWISGTTVEKKLVPGGKVMPKEVIMTIVDPTKLQIRTSVPEAKLKHLEPGLKGTAHPAWDKDATFDSKLEKISYIPFSDKTFDSVFSAPVKANSKIYPGMGAKISIELYKNEKALAVPKSAVKKEGNNHFVTMKDGKKRKVKVGKSSSTQTEILEGLKVDEEIKTK